MKLNESKKLNRTLLNVNENKNSNIQSLTSTLPSVAPPINIKTNSPSSCADTGSDSILLRHSDAIAATLTIHPKRHPLQVRFPDGQTARSIGITDVALLSTDIPVPARIFTDDSLRQSLFGISDITNLEYDATFRKDGLYLYNANAELVHPTPKFPDDSSWTLPIQRPSALANAVISLPSDKKMLGLRMRLSAVPPYLLYCELYARDTFQRCHVSRLPWSASTYPMLSLRRSVI